MPQEKDSSRVVLLNYNARNTILQLLDYQGYYVKDYENFSINEVCAMMANNQLNMLLHSKDDNDRKKTYVSFSQATVPDIRKIVEELYDDENILDKGETGLNMLVIISPSEIPETMNKTLNEHYEKGYYIVAFHIGTLQYNILNHVYVPKHTILDKEEKNKVMEKYNILDDNQFPTISRFDAVAKAIGMRPNDVCKIDRPSHTAIVAEYFRLCTK